MHGDMNARNYDVYAAHNDGSITLCAPRCQRDSDCPQDLLDYRGEVVPLSCGTLDDGRRACLKRCSGTGGGSVPGGQIDQNRIGWFCIDGAQVGIGQTGCADCPRDSYCAHTTMECVPKGELGAHCSADYQCVEGRCDTLDGMAKCLQPIGSACTEDSPYCQLCLDYGGGYCSHECSSTSPRCGRDQCLQLSAASEGFQCYPTCRRADPPCEDGWSCFLGDDLAPTGGCVPP